MTSLRRAVFLDRDGTLIEDRHYLSDPGQVCLLPGVVEALHRLRGAGLALVVVTNQSGIGRGLYTVRDYHRVAEEVDRQLAASGIEVDGTYFCPDPPDLDAETTCRKPSPVLYRAAARELGLELRRSYYVGDKRSDVVPAHRFDGTGILVRTGHGRAEEPMVESGVQIVDTLSQAATLICGLEEAEAPVDPPDGQR